MCSPLNTPTPDPGSDILAYAGPGVGPPTAIRPARGSQYSHRAFRLRLNSGAVGAAPEVLVSVRRWMSSLVM